MIIFDHHIHEYIDLHLKVRSISNSPRGALSLSFARIDGSCCD